MSRLFQKIPGCADNVGDLPGAISRANHVKALYLDAETTVVLIFLGLLRGIFQDEIFKSVNA